MKLKEYQKIYEDIINEKIEPFEETYVDKEELSDYIPLNQEIKENSKYIDIGNEKYMSLLNFIEYKNKIYLLPRYFLSTIRNFFSEEFKKYKNLDYNVFEIITEGLSFSTQTYSYKFEKNDDKELLKNLFKQQILITKAVKDYLYNDLIKFIGGEDKIIKYINNKLPEKEKEEIIENFNLESPNKGDELFNFIMNQFDKNKNIDIDKTPLKSIYNINVEINEYGEHKINIDAIRIDEVGLNVKNLDTRKLDQKNFKGIKGSKNKLFFETTNKKEFINILKENNYFGIKEKKIFREVLLNCF